MTQLDKKYVLHIPTCKYIDNKLISLNIDEILDDLIKELRRNGLMSFYLTNVKSYYKSRVFDEVLFTVFTSSVSVDEIFTKWFKKNNNLLQQEAFSFEYDNMMFVEKLD